METRKKFAILLGVFHLACFLPIDHPKVSNAIPEAFRLLQWYAVKWTLAAAQAMHPPPYTKPAAK